MAGGGFFSFLDEMTFVEDDSSSYEINISDSGFCYLDMLSEKKAKRIAFEEKQKRETSAALDGSTRAHGKLNIKKVEEVDHDALCLDTNPEKIISDIQERRQKMPVFPWCALKSGDPDLSCAEYGAIGTSEPDLAQRWVTFSRPGWCCLKRSRQTSRRWSVRPVARIDSSRKRSQYSQN